MNIVVNTYGLHDPDDDLILVGVCEDCGAELWRRQFRCSISAKLDQVGLHALIARSVKEDANAAAKHTCRTN